MNIEKLQIHYHELLSEMLTLGYSEDYVNRFRKEILWILKEAPLRSWKNYDNIHLHYKSTIQSPNVFMKKRIILGVLENFDLYGKFPDSKHNRFIRKYYPYENLVPAFRKLVDHYVKTAKEQRKKESTIYMESHNSTNFLLALQEMDFKQLNDVTEEAVLSIFISPEGTPLKGHTYRRSATELLKACINIEPTACQKVSSFLPVTNNIRKNIQYLTKDEVEKVYNALNNTTNNLSLCDRAIGKLVLYTGLRSSDIAAMELSSIDWERDIIRIKQQKTDLTLELPLTATVGNAIYEYLIQERPITNNQSLFISRIGAKKGLTDNIWYTSKRIMDAAGIRQEKGDRKGLHLFRHHLATALLGNEVSQVVISRTLGHSSPSSTETYFSADLVHLKACALSVTNFVISEEVFEIV